MLRSAHSQNRCEAPKQRQSQTYYLDFNTDRMEFEKQIHRAKIKTAAGVFDMQPKPYYDDAAEHGFNREAKDYAYAVLNNFAAGQNALGLLNPGLDTFDMLGHYNESGGAKLTESAVNRLPDGTWLTISRQDGGNGNYMFSTSKDGKAWTANEYRAFVPNGGSCKPTFDKFFGIYYLGWQQETGVNWERKYRFESTNSFQYPTFPEYRGAVYLTVTQGDLSPSRKEWIMFGKLE